MPLKSSWINIDRLGLKGIEPDMMPVHREPNSLDEAVNVRALGPNLANAGGYRLVPNASLPQATIPSSCACPTVHYERTSIDGDVDIDQSWFTPKPWDAASRADHWITALEVNAAGQDYDQTLIIQEGECNNSRLESIQIQIINTAPTRKVRVILTDNAGTEQPSPPLDYDASPIFGDGQTHWVFIEKHLTSTPFDFRIFIDSTSIFDDSVGATFTEAADYVTFRRANSQTGTTLPVTIWAYSQSLWTCLTGGGYTGLGSCPQTGPQAPILMDVPKSNVDLDFYRGNVVATTKAGTASSRNAYSNIKPVTGPVYFEVVRDNAVCRATTYWGGASGRAIDMESGGPKAPGTVSGSVGVNRLGDVYIDGSQVAGNVFQVAGFTWLCVAYDPVAGQVWFGNARGDGVQEWAGNLVPGIDAGYPTIMTDPVPQMQFFEDSEAMRVISSDGCRFALPSGFSYLEPS